jgi:hypothetical protein
VGLAPTRWIGLCDPAANRHGQRQHGTDLGTGS